MMVSKIVVSSSISESEKLKSLAGLGESSFNVRYLSPYYLAEYLLQLSGITYKEQFIKNDDLSAILYKDIKDIPYFEKFSYNDILGLIETIQDVRYHIIDDEDKTFIDKLPTDQFVKKNQAIKEVYELIKNFLKDNNYIDEVGVIRFALANIKPIQDTELVKYEKSHLRPLEEYLIDFASGKHVEETKINEVDKPLKIERYTKAFGQSNEIEDILSYIYKNNIRFDDCVIASASGANYANILTNYRDLIGFPLTIGLGKLVTETNPGKLWVLLYSWEKNLFHKDFLKAIIYSDCFDLSKFKTDINWPEDLTDLNQGLSKKDQISFEKFIEIAGDLRFSYKNADIASNNKKLEEYENLLNEYVQEKYNETDTTIRLRTLPFLKSFTEIINKGQSSFIETYSLIKDPTADISGLGKILKILSFRKYDVDELDIVNQIGLQKVARVSEQQGTIYYTSISNAFSCLRKHLFIVGLSSDNFPGKNVENPFMLDRDYRMFGEEEYSTREIRNNKDDYFALLEEAKKYDVKLYLSWASYNEETLKNQNSSSVIFETYKLENGDNKTIHDFEEEFKSNPKKYRYIEFFNNDLLPINPIGKSVTNNEDIEYTQLPDADDSNISVPVKEMLDGKHAFSASAVTNYAKCPYMFYLINILGLQSKKDVDLTEVIPTNDCGTLAHELLEHLNKKATSLNDFLKEAEKRFNEYLIFHPAESTSLANIAKTDFLSMMSNAYDMENFTEVETAEKDYYFTHIESGVRIHGLPDKIYKMGNNHFVVVDYKTGRKVKHDVNDIASMIQCTIYSYIFSHYKKGAIVDGFEYRYIRTGDRVYSSDDNHTMQEHYDNLTNTLKELDASLKSGEFKEKPKDCDHCFVKDYCRKRK